MKWIKMWILLSLLTSLMVAGCNAETTVEPEATASLDEPTIESEAATSQPTLAIATAVPLPTTTETTRTIRLTPAATPQVEVMPTVAGSGVVGEVPEEMITAVYEDLTIAENISKAAITITRAEAITWSDGALGCPQPGEVYTQATVPGYWIVLEVNGRSYDYHAAESGYFVLCQDSQPATPPIVGTPIS